MKAVSCEFFLSQKVSSVNSLVEVYSFDLIRPIAMRDSSFLSASKNLNLLVRRTDHGTWLAMCLPSTNALKLISEAFCVQRNLH